MQKGIAKMQLQEFEHTELKKYLTLVFTLHMLDNLHNLLDNLQPCNVLRDFKFKTLLFL